MVVGFTHRVMHVVECADAAHNEVEAILSRLKLDSDTVRVEEVSIAVPRRTSTTTMPVGRLNLTLKESLVVQGRGKSSVL